MLEFYRLWAPSSALNPQIKSHQYSQSTLMSTTATSLSDSLPSSIPKLDSTGINWAIFSVRFQDAVEAKGFWGHFDGSTPRPAVISVTTAEGATTVDPAAVDQWDKDERSAKSLLTQKIPDSTLMRIHGKKSVKERWDAIEAEYTEKGAYAQTDLRARFLESKCSERGNVREFLDSLHVKREELASVGVDIDEKDYRSTIISSLPTALANFASSQLASARLYAPTKTIAPDSLISLISEEFERQRTQRMRRSGGSKSKEDDKDEALSATAKSSKSKRGDRKPRGVCWNCGEKGHYKDKCPKPAKDAPDSKKEKAPTQSGSANAVVESDSESEGAFAMDFETDEEDEEGGWFTEAEDDEIELRFSDIKTEGDLIHGDPTSCEVECPDDALIANEPLMDTKEFFTKVEVYDSGCTKHISPYQEDFRNYTEISPKSFRAANKQNFRAVGMGEMTIDVPDGADFSQLHLKEVLYSPDVGYTLISIGNLDEEGFSAEFAGGKCVLTGPNGDHVGMIPKTSKGLYRVEHESEAANTAEEKLTLMQFHRRMGHISVDTARKLVMKGFVTGVCLDENRNDENFFCESCVYAKATRKPILKVRQGERATQIYGDWHQLLRNLEDVII